MIAAPRPRLLRAALAAAGRGWPVFPLIPGGTRPAITGWQHHAAVDADVLTVWWRGAPYNVGVACGPAGLLVVDLDGPAGRSRFAHLAQSAEPVPTFTVATPSGGEHRYYTVRPGAPAPSTVARLGPQIDSRGVGGYVVGPGSVRRTLDGRRNYRITDSRPPTRCVPGEPGIYWVARGLMVETCAQLLGGPISLDLLDHPNTVFIHALICFSSTVLSAEPLGDLTTVELVVAKQDSRWALIVDNRLLGLGINVPSPAHLAGLVAANDHRRRNPEPTRRGPVTRPTHLW